MVKHTQTIRLSVFDQIAGLALNGLTHFGIDILFKIDLFTRFLLS